MVQINRAAQLKIHQETFMIRSSRREKCNHRRFEEEPGYLKRVQKNSSVATRGKMNQYSKVRGYVTDGVSM